ncbi:MAG: archaetidylserine decarboxylase [Spirochaetes bacterium]|jgi:phosphatidylserine decarboxylase|nr:archaetidylserine decarboxylase [Spirochaetota bacterium]
MKRLIFSFLYYLIPDRLISRSAGYLSGLSLPRFVLDNIISFYCRHYSVDTDEILYPEDGFKSFDEFFTRKLKDGIHVMDRDSSSIISPVDGRLDQLGTISAYTMLQAKGSRYLLSELIPDDGMNRYFIGGSYITLYLSPADYHRIHSPLEGRVIGYSYYPGRKYSVRPSVVCRINRVYCKNERLVSYISSACGIVAVCKVGAMNVGYITPSYQDPSHEGVVKRNGTVIYTEKMQTHVDKGGELGIFHMGSTVIMLFQKDAIQFGQLKIGERVRVGTKIAHIN